MDHPYCYPGTDVYRNKEEIRDKQALEDLERAHSADRLLTLRRDQPVTPEGYCEIHRYILQDVYDWAGQYRRVDTGRGFPFCKAEFIADQMAKRFAVIRSENNLRRFEPKRFAARAAEHLNELNAIHPFLDGNGRTQRAFLEILAGQAGHEVDLARIDPKAWNDASIEGFVKLDHSAMSLVIGGALVTRRPRRS